MKRLGVFLLPLDGMLVHRRSLPRNLLGFPNNLPVPIYTPGWREALRELTALPNNTTHNTQKGAREKKIYHFNKYGMKVKLHQQEHTQ